MCASSNTSAAGAPSDSGGCMHVTTVDLTPAKAPRHAEVGPPYTPRPKAQQRWVHSCCSVAKLKRALADPDVTAIEADIMAATDELAAVLLGSRGGDASPSSDLVVPVMAHPSGWRGNIPSEVDMTFGDFLEHCLADGTRHLKLDFKHLAAVEPCLKLLAEHWPQLHSNGQAVWLNADILPGPNARSSVAVPAHVFVPLCRRLCPHAVLSLGWCVAPLGPEQTYSEQDVSEMLRACDEHSIPGSSVVFAASIRFVERNTALMGTLLERLADAQLLLWTGTGELPIQPEMQARIHMTLAAKGLTERIGYDVAIAQSSFQQCAAHAIDCTFVWSRWTRWLCCQHTLLPPNGMYEPVPPFSPQARSGERQPLVQQSTPSTRFTPSLAPTPQRMPSNPSPP